MGLAISGHLPLHAKTLAGLLSAIAREISHDHCRQYGGIELLPPVFVECRRAAGDPVSLADLSDYLPLAG